ncbi:hypothetical protein SDC9_118001 [bioreactor metagenome]|uniref:Uncharacterized protein n=1 Tax=bioreactor metagenome TaxID=1076179 RepID=A0A645C138_9ZZZZ
MLFKAEDGRALCGFIGAHAFKGAAAIVQRVGQHMDLGIAPLHQLAIHPDLSVAVGHRGNNRAHKTILYGLCVRRALLPDRRRRLSPETAILGGGRLRCPGCCLRGSRVQLFLGLGTLQLPLHEAAGDELAGHMGLRAVGPAVDLGALAFFGQALAQGAGHGHHMDQRDLGLELGIEHHGAAHIADRPVRRFLHDGHQAREVQQPPHEDAACHRRHAGPARRVVGRDHQHDQAQGNQNIAQIHGLIVLRGYGFEVADSAYAHTGCGDQGVFKNSSCMHISINDFRSFIS